MISLSELQKKGDIMQFDYEKNKLKRCLISRNYYG